MQKSILKIENSVDTLDIQKFSCVFYTLCIFLPIRRLFIWSFKLYRNYTKNHNDLISLRLYRVWRGNFT